MEKRVRVYLNKREIEALNLEGLSKKEILEIIREGIKSEKEHQKSLENLEQKVENLAEKIDQQTAYLSSILYSVLESQTSEMLKLETLKRKKKADHDLSEVENRELKVAANRSSNFELFFKAEYPHLNIDHIFSEIKRIDD